ncbi:MAG: signal peptidase I [Elusimicrobia bacterium]|nr:signal peptidase I [Elusimicrobiota bacterium]
MIGVLLAVTIYAYLGNVRGFTKAGILGGAAGFVFGFAAGQVKGRSFKAKHDLLSLDLEWAETASSAVILASIIMYVLIQAFKIPSGSMQPTLYEGDHLFVNKFYYGVRIPFTDKRIFEVSSVKRKDIVIFRFPSENENSQHFGKDFIKRAVALEGDSVMVRNKRVFINGQAVGDEPYTQFLDPNTFERFPDGAVKFSPQEYQQIWQRGELSLVLRGDEIRDNFGPVSVPKDSYFVMGDNRDASFDSRFWGPMPKKYLKGKAWFIYWPPRRVKVIK